jgi:hypothetical protein
VIPPEDSLPPPPFYHLLLKQITHTFGPSDPDVFPLLPAPPGPGHCPEKYHCPPEVLLISTITLYLKNVTKINLLVLRK